MTVISAPKQFSLPAWVEFPALAHPALDDVAAEVAQALGVSVAQITVLSQTGQTMPGAFGLTGTDEADRMTTLAQSICQHVVRSDTPLVIPDLRWHPTLHDSYAVSSGIIAYAGVPLHGRAGQPIGALCALDVSIRDWTESDVEWLLQRSKDVSLLVQIYSTELRMAESSFAMARARSTSSAAHEAAAAHAQQSTDAVRRRNVAALLSSELGGVEEIGALTEIVSRYAATSLQASDSAIVLLDSTADAPIVIRAADPDGRPVPVDSDENPLLDRTPGAPGVHFEYAPSLRVGGQGASASGQGAHESGSQCTAAQLPLRIDQSGMDGCLLLRWQLGAIPPDRETLTVLAELLAPTLEWVLLNDLHRKLLRLRAGTS